MVQARKIVIILGVLALLFSAYWFLLGPQPTANIEQPMYSKQEETSDSFMDVTQGSTWQKNITLILSLNKEVSIPFETLTIMKYNKTLDVLSSHQKILNFTFCPNPLTVTSKRPNTTVLEVTIAPDAPVGRYDLIWHLGNSNDTNIGGYGLIIRVNPKSNA